MQNSISPRHRESRKQKSKPKNLKQNTSNSDDEDESTPIAQPVTKKMTFDIEAGKKSKSAEPEQTSCCSLRKFIVVMVVLGGLGYAGYYLVNRFSGGGDNTDSKNWNCFPKFVNRAPNFDFYSAGRVNGSLKNGVFVQYSSVNGSVVRERIHLKGVSWSGFETDTNLVHGLWERTPDEILSFMQTNGFNAIRLPMHIEVMTTFKTRPKSFDTYINRGFASISSFEAVDLIVKKAAEKGILILLDLHSFAPNSFKSDGLWYNSKFNESDTINAWTGIAERFAENWNIIGADIKNEPFDATWGDGNVLKDFRLAAERIGNAIIKKCPNWLIFVEGTYNVPSSPTGVFKGENLIGVRNNPVRITFNNTSSQEKVVYSPHVYGPSVYDMDYFKTPALLNQIWTDHWGYIHNKIGTIVVGEWGTKLFKNPSDPTIQSRQDTWTSKFISYLIQIDARDAFYWMLNPEGVDTTGVLSDDWRQQNAKILELTKFLQPNPTIFKQTSNSLCIYQNRN
jgi:endoglucanase